MTGQISAETRVAISHRIVCIRRPTPNTQYRDFKIDIEGYFHEYWVHCAGKIRETNLRQPSGEYLAVVFVALAIFYVGVFGHFVFGTKFGEVETVAENGIC